MARSESGWWCLKTTFPLNDVDREHVSQLIKEGYEEGELFR